MTVQDRDSQPWLLIRIILKAIKNPSAQTTESQPLSG